MSDSGYQIVVMEIAVKFLLPASAGDELVVETQIAELGRASTRWAQRLLRGTDILVTFEMRAAITDGNGKPCRPPPELMTALAKLQ